jgi:hypothetical protein
LGYHSEREALPVSEAMAMSADDLLREQRLFYRARGPE